MSLGYPVPSPAGCIYGHEASSQPGTKISSDLMSSVQHVPTDVPPIPRVDLFGNPVRAGVARQSRLFAFPMECVETIAIIDSQTLLLVNDNNYPGGSPSRVTNRVDSNEFIRVRLPKALPVVAS